MEIYNWSIHFSRKRRLMINFYFAHLKNTKYIFFVYLLSYSVSYFVKGLLIQDLIIFIIGNVFLGCIAFIVVYFVDVKDDCISPQFIYTDLLINVVYIVSFPFWLISYDNFPGLLVVPIIMGPSIGTKLAYKLHAEYKKRFYN